MAYYPFRIGRARVRAGPQERARRRSATTPGERRLEWLYSLGQAGCFQEGFSSTGYADAQALFTSGKAAVYNIGTWELANLATDNLDAGGARRRRLLHPADDRRMR